MDIQEALRTYLFLIPVVVWLLSEVAKVITEKIRTGMWVHRVFQPGGMPSSHSAFVTSLVIVVGRKIGLDSVEFAITFVFACIVYYDAVVTRRVQGEQGKVLNRLQQWKKFSERMGHSLFEVLGGIIFGAGVTIVGILIS